MKQTTGSRARGRAVFSRARQDLLQRDLDTGYDDAMARQETSKFVHLHLHTHYSLLDSTISIPELVPRSRATRCRRLQSPITAISSAHFSSTKRRSKAGLRPVIGCEVYVAPGDHRERSPIPGRRRPYDHLVLLAENDRGYRNLVWLGERGISQRLLPQAEDLQGGSRGTFRGSDRSVRLSLGRGLAAIARSGLGGGAERRRRPTGKSSATATSFWRSRITELADEEFVRQGMSDVSRLTGIPNGGDATTVISTIERIYLPTG